MPGVDQNIALCASRAAMKFFFVISASQVPSVFLVTPPPVLFLFGPIFFMHKVINSDTDIYLDGFVFALIQPSWSAGCIKHLSLFSGFCEHSRSQKKKKNFFFFLLPHHAREHNSQYD